MPKTRLDTRRLLLIRHARTRMQPGIDPALWLLDDGATAAIDKLAERLATYRIAALATSAEPKAVATGRVLGSRLALEPRIAAGLHEHERSADAFVADQTAFERRLDRFFRYPDERVWGRETARQAQLRFMNAVAAVLRDHPAGDVTIVAHGTVITLFVARHNAVDALSFWRGLGMPCCVVLELPAFRLEAIEVVRE